jgi:hypothetical protein
MLGNHDLGASLYKTWTEVQRKEEIAKLVEGYRAGVPIGILCKMTETIAGNKKKAKKYLVELMPLEERKSAVASQTAGMQKLVSQLLLY